MRDDLDLHLHTAHVGCANETMSVPDLLARAEEVGYTHIAITESLQRPASRRGAARDSRGPAPL